MEIESERRSIATNTPSQAALQKVDIIEAANCYERRSISRRWKMRFRPRIELLLLYAPLFSGVATFAQYNPLPSPIAEEEVAGPARAPVRAGPSN